MKLKNKIDLFPLRHVLKNYSREQAKADFFAGLNVSLLDFPQGMAYALLLGFPVIYGVYASAIASIVGPLLASSRFVIFGPTNATTVLVLSSFLTLNLTGEEKLVALPVLLVLVGMFLILGSFLKLAGLIKYISRTVVTGYITAAALLLIVNQVGQIIGGPTTLQATTFFEVLSNNFVQLQHLRWEVLLIAGITVATCLLIKRYLKIVPTVAATLLIVSFLGFGMRSLGVSLEMLTPVSLGSWPWSIPHINFDLVNKLGGSALGVAFLAILESSSIAKTLAARSGKRVDINQQMFSLGASNIASALGSGLAVSGSLTRSMLNWSSGARTAVSSIFSGCMLVCGALLLGPVIGYVPQVSLSIMVIIVGLSLINLEQISVVVKSTRSDASIFFLTFLGGLLFPLNIAIFFGAAASIIFFLRKVSEPQLVEYVFNDEGELAEKEEESQGVPEISIVHVEGELFFGSTEIFLDQTRLICESPNLMVIILKVRSAHYLDATSAMAIADLIRFAQEQGRTFIVSGANEQVANIFKKSGVMDLLGKENFFRYSPHNPNLSMRDALKRAQEIIGEEKPNIILFTAPHTSEETPKSGKKSKKPKKQLASTIT